MTQTRLVSFISDEKLIEAVEWVVKKTRSAISDTESKMDKNRLDPFSAIFDSVCNSLSYEEWLKKEIGRKIQKTMQGHIGEFHQMVIGGIDGWDDLGTGGFVDAKNDQKQIVIEVKNKFNTEKGIHLIEMYDELENALRRPEYKDYTAYYVTIIGKKKDYSRPFTPSDRTTKQRRAENPKIIEISGYLFYDIATGQKNSLYELFKALPVVLKTHFSYDTKNFDSEKMLKQIYDRTYSWGGVAESGADEENGE